MGRRSRKRSAATPGAPPPEPRPPAPPAPRPARRASRLEGVPPAPWGSFPLSELCVLLGVALVVIGLVTRGHRGPVALAAGLSLASLAGLEVAIREHFAGFRSHTLVLSAAPAVATVAILFFTGIPRGIELAIAVAVFLLAFRGLREVFRRRSGGAAFR